MCAELPKHAAEANPAECELAQLPESVQAQVSKALELAKSGESALAMRTFMQLLKSYPGCTALRQQLHTTRQRAALIESSAGAGKSLSAGLAGLKALATRTPFNVQALQVKNLVHKNPLTALEVLERQLNSNPRSAHLLHQLGQAAEAAVLPQTACLAYAQAAEADAHNPAHHSALARAYLAAGNTPAAITAARAALAIEPASAEGLQLLEQCFLHQQR